jgi:hypothetical protein
VEVGEGVGCWRYVGSYGSIPGVQVFGLCWPGHRSRGVLVAVVMQQLEL